MILHTMKLKYFGLILCFVLSYPSLGQDKIDSLKVITYNIWNGFAKGGDDQRRDRFVEWVKQRDPDVLALQELVGFDQEALEQLAKEIGHDHSVILKEKGYPTGITSKAPIQLKEKFLEGMWHGLLHVQTFGIDFLVVHLSPSERVFRMNEAELIIDRISRLSESTQLVVLGDFNAHSPLDSEFDRMFPAILQRTLQSASSDGAQNKNLIDGRIDYAVMSRFLGIPLLDVCELQYVPLESRRTFPAVGAKDSWLFEDDNQQQMRMRIDFILVNQKLASKCVSAIIHNQQENWYISDHYPVESDFIFTQ